MTSQRHEHLFSRLYRLRRAVLAFLISERISPDSFAALHVNRLITGTFPLCLFLIRLYRAFQVNRVKLKKTKYINVTHYFVPEMECLYTGIMLKCRPNAFFTARRNARIASAALATAIPYVCLSVCLSVCHTPVLCQNDGM